MRNYNEDVTERLERGMGPLMELINNQGGSGRQGGPAGFIGFGPGWYILVKIVVFTIEDRVFGIGN